MSERLDILRPYLSRYTRRFSVLDFGAGINVPAIGCEIAREFDAVVTCVEKDIKEPEVSPRTMWLQKEFTVDDLVLMAECEFFDVVIGFNIAHWFGPSALKVQDTLRRMGRYVFLQSPHGSDTKAIETFGQHVRALDYSFRQSGYNWTHLGDTVQFPQHEPRPLWMFENHTKSTLTRTCISAHTGSASTVVISSYERLRTHLKGEWRDWIPGINLHNFLKWNGILPTRDAIVEWLKDYPLPQERHGDITPHNFIIDGERLHLIDGGDEWGGDDKQNLEVTIQKVIEA